MKRMTKKIKLNQNRDIPVLMYLWKWKVANTATIYHKFYSGLNPRYPYNRMLRLKTHGFVRIVTATDGSHPVWTLDQKGYQVVKPHLPLLLEDGYKSENIIHDLWCSAVHQGNFLIDQPLNVQIISEQQLRRFNLEELPAWVPTPELHRPDGYWKIKSGHQDCVIALELEKTRKSNARLQELNQFYEDFPSKYRVLWLVENKALANRVHKEMGLSIDQKNIHNIVLLKDFLESGWFSKILLGPERGQTIQDFLYEKADVKPLKSCCKCNSRIILDSRLCYQNDSKTEGGEK